MSQIDIYRQPLKRSVGRKPDKRSLQLSDVRLDLARDEQGYTVRKVDLVEFCLPLQYCYFGLQIRRLDVGYQTPFKPGM